MPIDKVKLNLFKKVDINDDNSDYVNTRIISIENYKKFINKSLYQNILNNDNLKELEELKENDYFVLLLNNKIKINDYKKNTQHVRKDNNYKIVSRTVESHPEDFNSVSTYVKNN